MPTHRASRSRARRRLGGLVGALALSVATGVAAVGAVPHLRGGAAASAASTASTTTAIEAASIAAIPAPVQQVETVSVDESTVLPADSGSGRRIVFDQSDQRVWLVDADDTVARTYLVSGSRFDNLQPGSYQVQSRTRHATAFDASGSMEYFVRFATGFSEPIGFHSVPVDNAGVLEQSKAQLGTPLSAGCVRQWKPDAIALWDFAPVGTPVTVTA